MLYYVIFIELSSISYFAGSLALTYRLVSLANFCYYLGLPDQKAFVTTAHCDSLLFAQNIGDTQTQPLRKTTTHTLGARSW